MQKWGEWVTQQYGELAVEMKDKIAIPTEFCRGVVHLNLKKKFPGDKIDLRIRGWEKTVWHTTHEKDSNKTIERTGHRDIFDQTLTVHDWAASEGSLQPGQYSFPFSFTLPEGLPGSFSFVYNGTAAEIAYQLTVSIPIDWNNKDSHVNSTKLPKFKARMPLIVREALWKDIEKIKHQQTWCLRKWICIPFGKVSLGAEFDKNAYSPEEEVKVNVEMGNRACFNFDKCKLELWQKVKMFDKNGTSIEFEIPHNVKELEGLKSFSSWRGDEKKTLSFTLAQCQKELFSNGDPHEVLSRQGTTVMGLITPSTLGGKLVTSKFELRVTSRHEFEDLGCTCCNVVCCPDPVITIPVQIYAAPLEVSNFIPPPNWHPVQMKPTNIIITINTKSDGTQEIVISTSNGAPLENVNITANINPNGNHMISVNMPNQIPNNKM